VRRSNWPILVGATFAVLVGHWLVMAGILLGEGGADRGFEPILIAAGLAVLAATVIGASLASGRELEGAVAAAVIGAAVLAAVWMLRGDEVPLPALVTGVALGAALGMARRPVHLLWVRLLMVAFVAIYAWWVTVFSAAFAILITPLLPFPTVGVSDFASEREAQRRLGSGYAAGR